MKARVVLAALVLGLLGGCNLFHHETLEPVPSADVVKVRPTNETDKPRPAVSEIKDPAAVEKLTAFVNALPPKWNVPWYGPPVGQVYFTFQRGGKSVANFYVGPNFFGRDTSNFWSQPATRKQIDELSAIVGFDVWAYAHRDEAAAAAAAANPPNGARP